MGFAILGRCHAHQQRRALWIHPHDMDLSIGRLLIQQSRGKIECGVVQPGLQHTPLH
jgi:hypothetical protein